MEIIERLKTELPKLPVFRINFSTEEINYQNSKIGGGFYWPEETGYPKLKFIAQINFAELPENEIFPPEGMLQFFIADDDAWGIFDSKGKMTGKGFKVVFHPTVEKGCHIFRKTDMEDSPVMKEAKMNFELTEESMSTADYRFQTTFNLDWKDPEVKKVEDQIYEIFGGGGSKLLGYPFFTQWDPREYKKKNMQYDRLLFQLDYDDEFISWGDAGVGNFFINNEKLKEHDFSDIFYTWDCY